MALSLSEKEYFLLSQLAYIDIPKDFKGMNLKDIADSLLNNKIDINIQGCLETDSDYSELLKSIEKYDNLKELKLKDIRNLNDSSGFFGYAFSNESGDVVFSFRGSEESPALWHIDWSDDFGYLALPTSIQYKDAEKFVKDNIMSGDIYVTGHSKGAANAAYICANFDGCNGIGFDGPGIGQQLDVEQAERLSKSKFINYVNNCDIIGSLFIHPEKVEYVKCKDIFYANGKEIRKGRDLFAGHYLQSFEWDKDSIVKVSNDWNNRSVRSVIAEIVSVNIIAMRYCSKKFSHAYINSIFKTIFEPDSYEQISGEMFLKKYIVEKLKRFLDSVEEYGTEIVVKSPVFIAKTVKKTWTGLNKFLKKNFFREEKVPDKMNKSFYFNEGEIPREKYKVNMSQNTSKILVDLDGLENTKYRLLNLSKKFQKARLEIQTLNINNMDGIMFGLNSDIVETFDNAVKNLNQVIEKIDKLMYITQIVINEFKEADEICKRNFNTNIESFVDYMNNASKAFSKYAKALEDDCLKAYKKGIEYFTDKNSNINYASLWNLKNIIKQ